jgi:hypothetical protein
MKLSPNIFKKSSQGIANIFKKSSDVGEDIFKKASGAVKMIKEQGPGIAEQISKGSGQAENILGKVSKISGKIASNPITQTLPFGSAIASGAGLLSSASKVGAKGAGQISEASDLSKYRKGGVNKQLENIGDIQKRGREIEQTGRELGNVFM